MSFHPVERAALAPELQDRLTRFETRRDAYVDVQQRFSGIEQETIRLATKASTLEAQADAAEQAWRKQAVQPQADQSEIKAEIERCSALRTEAKALREAVGARSGVGAPLLVEMAELRASLLNELAEIRRAHSTELLDQVLSQDGLRDALLQAFALSRDLYLNNLGSLEPLLAARCNGAVERKAFISKGIWEAFSGDLRRLFAGAEAEMDATSISSLPEPIRGEVVAKTPGELQRLRRASAKPLGERAALH